MIEALVPLALVVAGASLLPRWSPDGWLWTLIATAGFAFVLMRYLLWRIAETVLPAGGTLFEVAFVWVVFLAEVWLWLETLSLALILSRQTDRSSEADAHEIRLRKMTPATLPSVDVYIATYNEPLDVLEKTIAGALALDWPAARLNLFVLDDGRRDWLAQYCEERGIAHLVRRDNAHAKAGNINAAIARTNSPFILILDADFVPQPKMLMRSIGFFDDPQVGIVQMPHFFFNHTPLQTNMDLRHALPDEQRFFFDVIQPGRDGWKCGFCCGSNGIIRRSAIEKIGNAIPTDSITEDMLLTLALLRKGYITRYLGERLAMGLAPESMEAYFVQRERWARGAIQMLYTKHGPLGPGLTPLQRLLFSPSHWLSQSLCQPIAMATPAVFMLTGCPPFVGATLPDIVAIQIPAIAAAMAFIGYLAPRQFAPVASTVESVLQSFRLLPSVFWTLIKPYGHAFRVTPKGSSADTGREDNFTIITCLVLIFCTCLGLFLNTSIDFRVIEDAALLPIVAFWAIFNMLVLLIVITASVPRPVNRGEERFSLERACRLSGVQANWTGKTRDVSVSGALIEIDYDPIVPRPAKGDWLAIELAGLGTVAACVRRSFEVGETIQIGVWFHAPKGKTREALLQALFSSGLDEAQPERNRLGVFPQLLARIIGAPPKPAGSLPHASESATVPPDWVKNFVESANGTEDEGFRTTSATL